MRNFYVDYLNTAKVNSKGDKFICFKNKNSQTVFRQSGLIDIKLQKSLEVKVLNKFGGREFTFAQHCDTLNCRKATILEAPKPKKLFGFGNINRDNDNSH